MAFVYQQIIANKRKTFFLFFAFFSIIILIGFVFSYILDNPVVLIGAFLFSIILSISSWWYSDRIILAFSKAYPIEKKDNPLLYNIVENLSITAGLPMPKIYIIQEAAPNAFATGRNPENSVICVTSGLLEKLNKSEIEGVLAHELSHIQNYDTRLMTIAAILVGFIALISDWFLRWGWFNSDFDSDSNREGGNAFLFLIGFILAILAPLFAQLLQLAISRKREFLADASAALLTRYPQGLASALRKIAADPTPLKVASPATAHLFIANPFKNKKKTNFLQKLFSTHPPIEERIAALEKMAL